MRGNFKTKIWRYTGKGAWHFVTLPKIVAEEINFLFSHTQRPFGSIPVLAKIGVTEWKTSIFKDTKLGSYVLPVKKDVLLKERIGDGDEVGVNVKIDSDK